MRCLSEYPLPVRLPLLRLALLPRERDNYFAGFAHEHGRVVTIEPHLVGAFIRWLLHQQNIRSVVGLLTKRAQHAAADVQRLPLAVVHAAATPIIRYGFYSGAVISFPHSDEARL